MLLTHKISFRVKLERQTSKGYFNHKDSLYPCNISPYCTGGEPITGMIYIYSAMPKSHNPLCYSSSQAMQGNILFMASVSFLQSG